MRGSAGEGKKGIHLVSAWADGLRGMDCIRSTRTIKEKTTVDMRYFLTSLTGTE